MMKILVTGGTGFIGRYVLQKLCDSSNTIIATKRSDSIIPSNLSKEINWIDTALDCIGTNIFNGVDVLIHMASVGVSPKIASYEELVYWNVTSLFKLIDQAKRANVRRIVITGSFAEYGLSANHFEFLLPQAALLPLSPYAASKAAGCMLATSYALESKIEMCYLRIFSAYGEGQYLGNFWPALKAAAINGKNFQMTLGEQIRDFIPVEAVAREIIHSAIRGDLTPGIPLIKNVASGSPVSMRDFAEKWWLHFQAKGRLLIGTIPYRINEPMRFAASQEEFFLHP
jgi:nucleoside-diphosphate-sugar epimerase